MEICGLILLLLIFGPILAKLLRGLAPLLIFAIGVAIVLGLVSLTFDIVGDLVGTAFGLLFSPLGILLLLGAGGYLAYRQWTKRQPPARFDGGEQGRVILPDDKVKRRPQPILGDDGEIVTLDELLEREQEEKRKRR